jgi:hypothetical protein
MNLGDDRTLVAVARAGELEHGDDGEDGEVVDETDVTADGEVVVEVAAANDTAEVVDVPISDTEQG